MPTPTRAIHWFRRDLRITDNTGFRAALDAAEEVLPVYIVSRWKGDHLWTGPKRQSFLVGCISSLAGNLESIGGRLIVRSGDQLAVLKKLIQDSGATELHTNRDPDPFGIAAEDELQTLCESLGVSFHAHEDVCLHDRDSILKDDGDPYRVYTPYSRKWLKADKPEPSGRPRKLTVPEDIDSEDLPTLSTWGLKEPGSDLPDTGEKAARSRLNDALSDVVSTYDETRDIPSRRGTSRLSQDLRFGTLSIREIFSRVQDLRSSASEKQKANIDVYIKELAWREFYMQVLWQQPEVLELEYSPAWRGLEWDEPGDQFAAWKEGRTGFPIIDAGIRQLIATGFMHNRVRMIVAMFLTKDLHIDWRLGEQFFMQHLLDGEIASNNGGWQWSAGTGADAAPYFRIQNPWTQTKRFDPSGDYVKTWVPELKNVPAKKFFSPPENGQALASGYPAPIVDHSEERDRTLSIFKNHKEQRS